MAASGRYARGSVLSNSNLINFEFSHSFYRAVVLTSWDRSMSDCESAMTKTSILPLLFVMDHAYQIWQRCSGGRTMASPDLH